MSSAELLLRWRRARLRLRLFLPLAAVLVLLALLGHGAAAPLPSFADLRLLLLSFLVLAQLRLLDDLADRDYDRPRHPERVVVQADSLRPFLVALSLLTVLLVPAAFWLGSERTALALVVLDVAMVGFYLLSRALDLPRLVHAAGVLLKYPAIVFLLSGAPSAPGPLLLRLLGTSFLLAMIYELGHDRDLRELKGGRTLFAVAALLLLTLWIWPTETPT